MNTNISSLQTIVTALQNNDYVTGATPLMKDGKEIGYTITFSKSNPITIYHGKDGPHYKLVTYTTMSANLMLREVGISLFLAGVGLGAGEEFVPTLAAGGYVWIAYGAVITVVPLLLAGIFGRFYYKLNYYTLIGVLSGASTNPPALAYSAEQTSSDAPSVGYATVYPLSMFLRVLAAQLLILIFG